MRSDEIRRERTGFSTRAIHAARTPTRRPGRRSCRSTPPRPTPRRRPGSTRATSTRAAATRRAPPWRPAWPRSKAASAAWPSPRAWRRRRPCSSTAAARRRGRRRGRPLRRHLPPARTRLQAVGPRRPLHRRPAPGRLRGDHHAEDEAGLDRDADQPAAADPRHRRHRRAGAQARGACWRSTTPSPRPTCSSRSSSGPTSSSTARRSTSAATPTWSAAR